MLNNSLITIREALVVHEHCSIVLHAFEESAYSNCNNCITQNRTDLFNCIKDNIRAALVRVVTFWAPYTCKTIELEVPFAMRGMCWPDTIAVFVSH